MTQERYSRALHSFQLSLPMRHLFALAKSTFQIHCDGVPGCFPRALSQPVPSSCPTTSLHKITAFFAAAPPPKCGRDSPVVQIKPQDPVEFAADLKVPVLGLYAGADSYVKPSAVDAMRAGLVKSGSGSDMFLATPQNTMA